MPSLLLELLAVSLIFGWGCAFVVWLHALATAAYGADAPPVTHPHGAARGGD
jgi:hypothetical protein